MAKRTFVTYLRLLWSSLGIGVTNDKTTFGPSAAMPESAEQKNCGAWSFTDMANPWISEKAPEWAVLNSRWAAQASTKKPNV